jgi:hypothetical protein
MAPCFVSSIQGFLIGVMFMSVFSFSSDTILQCFLVDEELKRPSRNRPAILEQFVDGITK